MKNAVFYPLSLILIVLVAAFTPAAPWLRALGGGLLFLLWLYGLTLGKERSITYLPGHALFMLGLGLVGAKLALYAWLFVPLGSIVYEWSGRTGWRLRALSYSLVWLDIFACLHQLVAQGKGLAGIGLALWSAAVAVLAAAFVGLGILRLRQLAFRPADEPSGDIG